MEQSEIQHVFIVGAKSLGAYGGYETFVNKLTEYHQNSPQLKYHVACKSNGDGCMDETKLDQVSDVRKAKGETISFIYHNAQCFKIRIPERLGSAQAIYYDVKALQECLRLIQVEHIPHPIVYILACRIGPFARYFYKRINFTDI